MNNTMIVPFHDWCVIERERFEQTEGGIFIPDGMMDDPTCKSATGTVLAVGPGPLLETGERPPCQATVGDRVEYLVVVAKAAKVDGKEVDVVRDGNVICRLVKE